MLGGLVHAWFSWPNGAVLTNLVASALWVPAGYLTLLRHLHCKERGCYRHATVPIKGTPHKVCKRHAVAGGHSH